MTADRVNPWLDRNCRRCDHHGRCELAKALALAINHRTPLAPATADRMGVPPSGLFGPWTCAEYTLARRPPAEPPQPAKPADSAVPERPAPVDVLPPTKAPASIK